MSKAEHVSGQASIVWHEQAEVRYVTVAGEIDLSNADALAAALDARQLVVDMTKVDFMDSIGLMTLLNARQSASRFDLTVSRTVRKLLDLSGLLGVLEVPDEIDPTPTSR